MMRFAVKHDAVDKPAIRKVHRSLIPLWGGIAIFLSLFFTLFLYWVVSPTFRYALSINGGFLGSRFLGLFLGGMIIVIFGAIDDKWGLPPKLKLMGQVLATLVVIFFGVRILGITIPFFNKYLSFHLVISVVITLIWIVSLINSMNFIDGLDGLAGGVALIATVSFFIIAVLKPPVGYQFMALKVSYFVAVISMAFAGSLLAFLVFNFNPAKIFMGDCGAMFLGLLLASISVIGSYKGLTAYTLITPVLVLSIPIFDIIFAVLRRLKLKVPVSKADKSHLHHRLLALGLKPKQAVIILYTISVIFSSLAILLS
jgi:UDP-GlcNAc:undecaprenyl-phosphate GlcNAc-1-phosphate transferase